MNNKIALFSFFMVMSVTSCVYAGKKGDNDWRNYTHGRDYDAQRQETRSWSKRDAREGKEGSSHKPRTRLADKRFLN